MLSGELWSPRDGRSAGHGWRVSRQYCLDSDLSISIPALSMFAFAGAMAHQPHFKETCDASRIVLVENFSFGVGS